MSLPFNDLRLKPGEQPNAERLAELFEAIQSDFEYLDTKNAQASILTSLPTKSVVGRRILYKAATGVYWQLLYTGEETYPWAKIGGPPLVAEVATEQGTESTSFTNLTTTGPAIALPLQGDYDVHLECRYWASAAEGYGYMSYEIGGTAAVQGDGIEALAPGGDGDVGGRTKRKTGLTAVTLTAKYKKEKAGSGLFRNRLMTVDPVRVG